MIIITGGAGFIGSNLAASLVARDVHDITVCDNLGNSDKWKNLAKRELMDLVAPEKLFDYLKDNVEDIDLIFHMGAISSTTESDVDELVQSNFVFSRKLWKWCAQNGKRFIYGSASDIYGDGDHGFRDDNNPEAIAALKPLNPYGFSKKLFDLRATRLASQGRSCPTQWVGLRFFNVYGPNEYHKGSQRSVANQMMPLAANNAAAKLFRSNREDVGDGEQSRDFVYVEDCCDVALWFMDNPDKSGIFNVGTGESRSFNDLATTVYQSMGKDPKIDYIDMPDDLVYRYQYHTQADLKNLREVGYDKPFLTMEQGIEKYVKEYLAKEDPYR